MTKCYKNESNLKSTAYNQTGQNIFEQLSAYNSMSSHLRRILLAKSVVDSRNKSYVQKRKNTCRSGDCRSQLPKIGVTNELIDKLTHDSLHHPAGILRMNFDGKYGHQRKEQKRYVSCYQDYDVTRPGPGVQDRFSYEESDRTASRSRLGSRTPKSAVFATNGRSEKHRDSSCGYGRKAESACTRSSLKTQNHFLKERYEETSSPGGSYSDVAIPEMDRLSPLTNSSESSEERESAERHDKCITTADIEQKQDENAKYAEFTYGITREVMQNNLYTDEELEEVFQRHVNKNKGTLNMNKMLYEIYQLKNSLNMSDDSDDELEDLIQAQQLLNVSQIRPPTPPKVLNENKIQERLSSYQDPDDVKRRSSVSGGKTVVLIDANPELVVTERDILTSLVDADVDINRAEKICKSIFQKGRETGTGAQPANKYKDVPCKEDWETRSNSIQTSEEEKDFVTNDRVSQQKDDVDPEINRKST